MNSQHDNYTIKNSTLHPVLENCFPEKSKKEINIIKNIIHLLKVRNAVIVAHYYTDPEIQKLAEFTGGIVSDSLEMAKFCQKSSAEVLLIAGVRFMGETAKIFNPEKIVLMPTLKAECSLDTSCPIDEFEKFCNYHPDRTVVVYANTSVSIKARADWVVTSSIAVDLIRYLDRKGKKIIWAPDRYLGNYIKKMTGANILSWKGSCVVHEEFKLQGLKNMKKIYPNAAILVHPESPDSIINLADAVGSTSQLIKAAKSLPHKQIIVATDIGIFFKMQEICPEKTFFSAPTEEEGANCKICARCPWMKMNSLENILQGLKYGDKNHEIKIDESMRRKALIPLKRMLLFAKKMKE